MLNVQSLLQRNCRNAICRKYVENTRIYRKYSYINGNIVKNYALTEGLKKLLQKFNYFKVKYTTSYFLNHVLC